jgi:hypothetical protein
VVDADRDRRAALRVLPASAGDREARGKAQVGRDGGACRRQGERRGEGFGDACGVGAGAVDSAGAWFLGWEFEGTRLAFEILTRYQNQLNAIQ